MRERKGFKFGRRACAGLSALVVLAAAPSVSLATSTVDMLEGWFTLDFELPWTGSATRSPLFAGPFGESSERLWFPALGTLIRSQAQVFVSTEASFGGWCPGGNCSPIQSSLRIVAADTGSLLSNPTVWLYPDRVEVKDYPSPVFTFQPAWVGGITGVAGRGWEVGPLPVSHAISLSHSYTVPGGWTDLHAGPSMHVELELSTVQTYTAFSTQTYLGDGIAAARGAGAATDLSAAAGAAGYVRTLRGTSGATSSSNLELRDAEYALYGYGAGLSHKQFGVLGSVVFLPGSKGDPALDGFIDVPFIQTPLGAAGWYFAKAVAQGNEWAGRQWAAFFHAPPGLTSNLPGTTDVLGGVAVNARGFWHGYLGGSVQTLGDCVASILACGSGAARAFDGSSKAAVVQGGVLDPSMQYEVTEAAGSSRVAIFQPGAQTEATIALPAGQGHLFAFLAGAAVAIDFGSDDFAGLLIVRVGEDIESFSLRARSFSFLDAVGAPATEFVLLPGELAGFSSLTLSFDDAAEAGFMVASFVAAVPEAPSGALAAVGGLIVAAATRRRRASKR